MLLLRRTRRLFPFIKRIFADGGYAGEKTALSRGNEELAAKVRASFLASDRTYGARRVWHDVLAEGARCGLHRIERLMRLQGLKARPRRRRLPPDVGERQTAAGLSGILCVRP